MDSSFISSSLIETNRMMEERLILLSSSASLMLLDGPSEQVDFVDG